MSGDARWFSAIFSIQKSPTKTSLFLEDLYFHVFQALKPFPSSSPRPKDIPQCPNQSLGSSGSLILNVFFLRQKNHFRKMCLISCFSAVSGFGSIRSLFSGTPQYVYPRYELLRWSGARDWREILSILKNLPIFVNPLGMPLLPPNMPCNSLIFVFVHI